MTALGTMGFMVLEDLSLTDAIYYNIVTMSTVGYGDIHPTHPASRMFAVLLIVLGGATFLGVIANATEMSILRRESSLRTKKVNMVLGIFFSEVGHELLKIFIRHDQGINGVRHRFVIRPDWTAAQFARSLKVVNDYSIKTNAVDINLPELSVYLNDKRDFMLNLLENPVLVEHEAFSDTLLSVFHLLDELGSRDVLGELPDADLAHLTGDIHRIQRRLMRQWVVYMQHLNQAYPYLFSLAMRKNPFNPSASATITA